MAPFLLKVYFIVAFSFALCLLKATVNSVHATRLKQVFEPEKKTHQKIAYRNLQESPKGTSGVKTTLNNYILPQNNFQSLLKSRGNIKYLSTSIDPGPKNHDIDKDDDYADYNFDHEYDYELYYHLISGLEEILYNQNVSISLDEVGNEYENWASYYWLTLSHSHFEIDLHASRSNNGSRSPAAISWSIYDGTSYLDEISTNDDEVHEGFDIWFYMMNQTDNLLEGYCSDQTSSCSFRYDNVHGTSKKYVLILNNENDYPVEITGEIDVAFSQAELVAAFILIFVLFILLPCLCVIGCFYCLCSGCSSLSCCPDGSRKVQPHADIPKTFEMQQRHPNGGANFLPQNGFQVQQSFPPRSGFSPQRGFPPQSGFPTQQGFPPQSGFSPQHGFPPQSGFPTQQGFPPQSGFPTQQGFPPQGVFSPQQSFPPQMQPMSPNGGRAFPPQQDRVPQTLEAHKQTF